MSRFEALVLERAKRLDHDVFFAYLSCFACMKENRFNQCVLAGFYERDKSDR